jgi:hypothetical protein
MNNVINLLSCLKLNLGEREQGEKQIPKFCQFFEIGWPVWTRSWIPSYRKENGETPGLIWISGHRPGHGAGLLIECMQNVKLTSVHKKQIISVFFLLLSFLSS